MHSAETLARHANAKQSFASRHSQGELGDEGPGRWLRVIGEHALTASLTIVFLVLLLRLWNVDWSVPFVYSGDGLFFQMLIKTLADQGWHFHNSQLGAPFELDMSDFPQSTMLHFLIIKCIACVTCDSGLIFNLYFLMIFPLTSFTSLLVLRHFGCGFPASLVGSLLFAFIPHHLCAGPGHFITCGYMIPPMVMVTLWLYLDPDFLFVGRPGLEKRFAWLGGKTWASVLIIILMASSYVYLAFFGCFFLLLAGLANALSNRTTRPLKAAGLLVAVMILASIMNSLPTILYGWQHGANPDAARRSMGEAEHFGMRIAQLLMPVTGHRIGLLAWAKERFNNKLALVTENDFSALGLAGSFGFLLLIFRLLVRPRVPQPMSLLEPLSLFNVFAVLLATLGGFGLFCASVLPQIRSYCRMSMFIGFFSIFALVLTLDLLQQRYARTPRRRLVFYGLLALLLVGGALDQTPKNWAGVGAEPGRLAEFHHDARFIQHIEASMPTGAMIYQLPYGLFPEGTSYDLLRCYVHADSLRWSFPTMRGREGDLWNRDLIDKPADELAATLIFAGFQGIFIDRQGYKDRGAELESKLRTVLGQEPVTSDNERFSFFKLTAKAQEMHSRWNDAQWETRRQQALHPVLVNWQRGFARDLNAGPPEGRWCAAQGEMCLINLSSEERTVTLNLGLRTGIAQPAHLKVSSASFARDVAIDEKTGELRETISLPPGRNVIRFACDGGPCNGDPRRVFRIVEYRLRTEPDSWASE